MKTPYIQPRLYDDSFIDVDLSRMIDLGNGHVRLPIDLLGLLALGVKISLAVRNIMYARSCGKVSERKPVRSGEGT